MNQQVATVHYIQVASALLAEYAELLDNDEKNNEKVICILKVRDSLKLMYKNYTSIND